MQRPRPAIRRYGTRPQRAQAGSTRPQRQRRQSRDRQQKSGSAAGNENRDRQAEAMPPTSCTAPRRRSTACPALRAALRVDRQAAPADTPAKAGNPVSLRQHPQRGMICPLLGIRRGGGGRQGTAQKDPSRERHGIEAGPKARRIDRQASARQDRPRGGLTGKRPDRPRERRDQRPARGGESRERLARPVPFLERRSRRYIIKRLIARARAISKAIFIFQDLKENKLTISRARA